MKGIFGTGTRDFLVIRATALLMASYIVFIFAFILLYSPVEYHYWKSLFSSTLMKLATSFFMLAFAIHTWIGTWNISTDYLTFSLIGRLSKSMNLLYSSVTTLIIFTAFLWVLIIIW